jgi:8-oxo-dGTP diphosphatase
LTIKLIGIAIVEHDGKYLVGTRGPDVSLPGYSEFPGGKCEPSESPCECACRECHEETGLVVEPVELLLNVQHTYDHDAVDLHFWRCRPINAETVSDNHNGHRWVQANELPSLRFPEANSSVIANLATSSSDLKPEA